jgi:hypothetical protein
MKAEFIHWFWPGFFTLFGLFLLWRSPVGSPSAVAGWARTEDEETTSRLRRAWCKRRQAEEISKPVKLLPGAASIILAIITAFAGSAGAICYGILMLAIAGSAAAAYLQLRNKLPIRVAVLQPRNPGSVIPFFWFALASAQGLLALAALPIHNVGTQLGALFVCFSSLGCAWLAWRVTGMPALLAGEDLATETFVDARLRFYRAASILVYAFAQSFVFLSFAHAGEWSIDLSIVPVTFYFAWFVFKAFNKPEFTGAPA